MNKYAIIVVLCISSYLDTVEFIKLPDQQSFLVHEASEGTLNISPIVCSVCLTDAAYSYLCQEFGAHQTLCINSETWLNKGDHDWLTETLQVLKDAPCKEGQPNLGYSLWPNSELPEDLFSKGGIDSLVKLIYFHTLIFTLGPVITLVFVARKFYQIPNIGIDAKNTYKIMSMDEIESKTFNSEIPAREIVMLLPKNYFTETWLYHQSKVKWSDYYFYREIKFVNADALVSELGTLNNPDQEYVKANNLVHFSETGEPDPCDT